MADNKDVVSSGNSCLRQRHSLSGGNSTSPKTKAKQVSSTVPSVSPGWGTSAPSSLPASPDPRDNSANFSLSPQDICRCRLRKRKRWSEKSIVFYCGHGNIPGEKPGWDCASLLKGLGGSETALLNLVIVLAGSFGHEVTIYSSVSERRFFDFSGNANTRSNDELFYEWVRKHRSKLGRNSGQPGQPGTQNPNGFIEFLPLHLIDLEDHFSTFIVWRIPFVHLFNDIISDRSILWIHDAAVNRLINGTVNLLSYWLVFIHNAVDFIVVPSGYMRDFWVHTGEEWEKKSPHLKLFMDEKVVEMPNGLHMEECSEEDGGDPKSGNNNNTDENSYTCTDTKKNLNRIIWSVAPNRGLEFLLENLERFLEWNNELELHVFCHFNCISAKSMAEFMLEQQELVNKREKLVDSGTSIFDEKPIKNNSSDDAALFQLLKLKVRKFPRNLVYRGLVCQKDLQHEYAESAFFIYPARVPESFSICTWEALLHNLVTIVIDKGALSEVGRYGAHVCANEEQVLKLCQAYFTSDKSSDKSLVRKKIASMARQKIEGNFPALDWTSIGERWVVELLV